MNEPCPTGAELSRAFTDGAPEALRDHVGSCAHCEEAWRGWERVVSLGRALPDPAPDVATVAAMRRRLVGGVEVVAPRSLAWWRAGALLGAAAALVFGWMAFGRPEPEPAAAPASPDRAPATVTLLASPEARYLHAGEPPEELVRLTEGALTVHVPVLAPGHRFRVVTGDAEVVVHGTAFDVVAREDALVAVRVISGRVEVRAAGAGLVALGPGERWAAPVEAVAEVAEPPVVPAAVAASPNARPRIHDRLRPRAAPAVPEPVPPVASVAPAVSAPPPPDEDFAAGWQAFLGGDHLEASRAFERAGQRPEVAEDAAFWRAVSLARWGDERGAIDAFRVFLERWPASARRGEASAIVGWLLAGRGAKAEAAAAFERALDDPREDVRRSARAGRAHLGGER